MCPATPEVCHARIDASFCAPGNLSGAAAVSSQDVWAVGAYQSGGTYQPVAEHWDGQNWTMAS